MKNIILSAFIFSLCLSVNTISAQSSTDGTIEAINQMGESEIASIQSHWGGLSNLGSTVSDGLSSLNNYMDIAQSANDLYTSLQALDNGECAPDFSTDASAMMPTGCRDDPGCADCYRSSISNMTVVRRSLARLSCIYANTKNFTESAIAFGDNVSGIHGAMGIAWQYERKGIQDTFDNLKKTYDNKYKGLMTSLDKSLKGISECESKHGMEDWYQRAGFIYFELMKEKYKRSE